MKYRNEIKVTREFYENSEITDEIIFKDMIRKMVSDLPIDELKKIFYLSKTDPNSIQDKILLYDSGVSDRIKDRIRLLRDQDCILFESEINIYQ